MAATVIMAWRRWCRTAGLLAVVAGALSGAQAPALAQPTQAHGHAHQAPAEPLPPGLAAIVAQGDEAQVQLRAIEASARAATLDDTALKAKIRLLPPLDQQLSTIADALVPRLASIDARLAQLGPAPAKGQPPETAEIAQERAHLAGLREAIDAEIKQARLLMVEIDQLGDRLEARRRALFSTQLWTQGRSVFDPALWQGFVAAIPADTKRLASAITAEAAVAEAARHAPGTMASWVAALLGAFVIAVPGRRLLDRLGLRRAVALPEASRLRRSLLALWLVIVAVATPLLAGWLIRVVLSATGALTPLFETLATLGLKVIVFAALIEGLGRALLSRRHPGWRLAPISDSLVAALGKYPLILAVVVAVATFIAGANAAIGISLAGSVTAECLLVVLELVVIGKVLMVAGRERGVSFDAAPSPGQALQPGQGVQPGQGESQLPWLIAALSAWLGLVAAGLAVALGYLALASFIMRELVWVAIVLSTLFLLIRFVDDLFPALLGTSSRVGRSVRVAVGLSDPALRQIGILLSGLARVALLLFGWSLVVAPFGTDATDLFGRLTSADLVIRLGEVSISPGAIIGGILILLVGLLITRGIRSWLESRYLPATAMDISVRTSLASAVTYIGALVAVVMASAYLGLSLDRIALFASALSIGIGFGLQSIISNFVSGLILLVERPVKVGDWIAIGDLEGDVRRVNVRATEIEMRDRSRLIVPNLDLITKTVRNVTHGGALGRIRIVLRVNDDADPIALRDLLARHLADHPEVLAKPPAQVYLSDAQDGGLEFTCYAYVASARDVFRVKSDLLFQIVPDLKVNGFALANSTPVVNVGMDKPVIEPAAEPPPPLTPPPPPPPLPPQPQ